MPADASANDLSGLIEVATASIERADVGSLPFPHITFDNFLPADFYRELTENMPVDDKLHQLNRENTRTYACVYGPHLAEIDPDPDGRWHKLSALLLSPELENCVRNKLAEGLEIRRKGEGLATIGDLQSVPRPVIYKDVEGYEIRPHTDTQKKLITMQLYLPVDDSQKDMGTTLYRASLKGLKNIGTNCLESVKTFPFLPNVGYAFVVLKPKHSLLKASWHGRPMVNLPTTRPRYTILNTYYTDEKFGL